MNDKKIDYNNFIDGYLACTNETLKEEYFKNFNIVTTYIPFSTKKICSESILQNSCLIKNSKKESEVKIDSCTKYISYIFTLIMLYTNLDISETNISDGYDKLVTAGLFERVMGKIPIKEKEEFDMVLEMVTEDFVANNHSGYAYIKIIFDNLLDHIGSLNTSIMKKLMEKSATQND